MSSKYGGKMSFMSEGEDRCLLFRVLYIFVGLRLLAHEPHDSSPAEKKLTVVISSHFLDRILDSKKTSHF